MSDRMVLLAIFGNPVEAELARAQLEAEGIRAVVMGATSGDLFAGMGVGLSNVQLLVPEGERERAARMLDAAESDLAKELREERDGRRRKKRKKRSTAIKEEGAGATASTDIRSAVEADPSAAPPPSAEMAEGEAEPPDQPPDDEEEREQRPLTWTPDDMAIRAFRAALFGYFTGGVLHLYALWVLAYIPFTEGTLSPTGARKAWSALALAGLPVVAVSAVLLAMLSY